MATLFQEGKQIFSHKGRGVSIRRASGATHKTPHACPATAGRQALPKPPSGGTIHYLTPVGRQPNDRRHSKPAGKGRYRNAGRVLQTKRPGSVLSYVTRALRAARLAGASKIAPPFTYLSKAWPAEPRTSLFLRM